MSDWSVRGPSKVRLETAPVFHVGGDYAVADDESGVIVGEAYSRVGVNTFADARGNALLFAASREMRDALRPIEQALMQVEFEYSTEFTGGVSFDEAFPDARPVLVTLTVGQMRAARAALAKALGGGAA